MKITANRYEDIIKQRDEYDLVTQEFERKRESNHDKYKADLYDAKKSLEREVVDLIGDTKLDLEIYADPYGTFGIDTGWAINVKAHSNGNFDDAVALVWNWEVKFNEKGEIIKDSGSWSGLKAITAEQLDDLEESVRVLKLLNNADWAEILNAPKPKYEDYSDPEINKSIQERKSSRPDFESDLISAQLEDLVGTNTAVKLSDDAEWRGNVWMFVTGITDKFVKGYIFPQFYLDKGYSADEIREKIYERRTSKSKLVKDGSSLVTLDIA